MPHPLNALATPIFIQSYKIPISHRSTESYKKKEPLFTTSLDVLFDIAQQNLKSSGLITKEDHDFLVYHWEKTISTTADHDTRNAVQKKLARKKKALSYTLAQTAGPSSSTGTSSTPASPHCSPTSTDVDEFVPKRACTTTPRSTGTSITIPRDILKKVGPAADRLGLSNQQVTGVLASIVNHSGGNLDDVSISTSTARNSRTLARKEAVSYIKKTFSFTCGQIKFDGKLLQEFGGTEKVNRLAVVAVQEEENQLLCVTKTVDSTGRNHSLLFCYYFI